MADGKRALVTGVTGQDGSYLVELLLEKGYEVHGIIRRSSTFSTARIDHLYHDPHEEGTRLYLHYGDLADTSGLSRTLEKVAPDEVYNLAAQSHVGVSFELPEFTTDATGVGNLRVLEAIRRSGLHCRFYQAGSSEMFGNARETPQTEETPFRPRSPYGIAKVYAHHTTVYHREAYGMFCVNGILFNHESPRRGETFVSRKITRAVAAILAGRQRWLYLGSLQAKRDWGYAPEYVEAMWRMLQRPEPDDYVIATGESHSVADFVAAAFGCAGLDWREHVRHDDHYERPAEIDALCGDASKARRLLGWEPSTRFPQLVRLMVEADLRAAGVPPEKVMVDD